MTSRPLKNCVVIFQLRLLATDVIKEQMSLVEDLILVNLMIYLNGFKIGIPKNIVQMPKPGSIVLPEMKEMPILQFVHHETFRHQLGCLVGGWVYFGWVFVFLLFL